MLKRRVLPFAALHDAIRELHTWRAHHGHFERGNRDMPRLGARLPDLLAASHCVR